MECWFGCLCLCLGRMLLVQDQTGCYAKQCFIHNHFITISFFCRHVKKVLQLKPSFEMNNKCENSQHKFSVDSTLSCRNKWQKKTHTHNNKKKIGLRQHKNQISSTRNREREKKKSHNSVENQICRVYIMEYSMECEVLRCEWRTRGKHFINVQVIKCVDWINFSWSIVYIFICPVGLSFTLWSH